MSIQSPSIPTAIRDRISSRTQPHVWTPDDFADLGPRTAVDQALHRLSDAKQIRRIARGLYDTPQVNRLTGNPNSPDLRAIVDALARRGKARLVVDGLTAANDLGLTDAVPARVTVLTNGVCSPLLSGTGFSISRLQRQAVSTGLDVLPCVSCKLSMGFETCCRRATDESASAFSLISKTQCTVMASKMTRKPAAQLFPSGCA